MASTLTALQTVTVGAGGSASITFSNIPQTYTDLVIKLSARSSAGTIGVSLALQFNGSSGNVSTRYIYTNSSTVASGAESTSSIGLSVNASDTTANTFSNAELYIPNYTGSSFKSSSVDSVTENNSSTSYLTLQSNLWSSTSAINQITLTPFSGNLVQYSTFTLYGVYKDAAETTPAAPTIGTATAGSQAADVAFTPAGSGAPASSYVVTSSPGGLTATGASSPIQIGGLTSGTAYTFTVRGQNPGGLGAASAASNSVTPYDGYESIATVYGNGSATTLSFTSIPSGYTHLQVRYSLLINGGGVNLPSMRVNNDATSNYVEHRLTGNGSTASAGSATGNQEISIFAQSPGGDTTYPTVGVIDILDYKDTNKYKTVRTLVGCDKNGSGGIDLRSGLWMSTSAITQLNFITQSSYEFKSGTVFELYGIR